MILIKMFRNGQLVDPNDGNDSSYYSPEKALAILVGHLKGYVHITSISTGRSGKSKIVIDFPEKTTRIEFQGHMGFMDLLHTVCFLYAEVRPGLCSKSVRALVK